MDQKPRMVDMDQPLLEMDEEKSYSRMDGDVYRKPTLWQRFKKHVSMVHLILIGAALGVGLGFLLAIFRPSETVVSWIQLPGDLFFNSLACIVVPLIFTNMLVGMATLTQPAKKEEKPDQEEENPNPPKVAEMPTDVLQEDEWMTLDDEAPAVVRATSIFDLGGRTRSIGDESGEQVTEDIYLGVEKPKKRASRGKRIGKCTFMFYMTTTMLSALFGLGWVLLFLPTFTPIQTPVEKAAIAQRPEQTRDVSQSIQALFKSLVPSNIFSAMTEPDVLGVISFACFLGFMSNLVPLEKGKTNMVVELATQLNAQLLKMVKVIIFVTPIGVLFLIAGTLAANPDFIGTLQDLGLLVACVLVGHTTQVFIFYPLIYTIFVRKNPYVHLKRILQAALTAFGTSSSAATLPVTMDCVENKCSVAKDVSRIVLPLGATINMDGTALYFPPAIVFIAVTIGAELSVGAMVMVTVVGTLAAMGASPIPNAGLVLIILVWESAFPHIPVPSQIAYLLVLDFILDRTQTVVNIIGDTVCAAVVDNYVSQ